MNEFAPPKTIPNTTAVNITMCYLCRTGYYDKGRRGGLIEQIIKKEKQKCDVFSVAMIGERLIIKENLMQQSLCDRGHILCDCQ